jgi:hypothetical protein
VIRLLGYVKKCASMNIHRDMLGQCTFLKMCLCAFSTNVTNNFESMSFPYQLDLISFFWNAKLLSFFWNAKLPLLVEQFPLNVEIWFFSLLVTFMDTSLLCMSEKSILKESHPFTMPRM